MAYNKSFNPDALPAHAQPDEAAQALGSLQGNRRPSPSDPASHPPVNPASIHPSSPPRHHLSATAVAAQQQSYQQHRPPPVQPAQQSAYQPLPPQIHHDHTAFDNYSSWIHSAPPTDYGLAQRPKTNVPQRLPPSLPSRTPAPPDPDSADLYPLFRAANASQTGALAAHELGSALVNADYSPFDAYTIKMMMRMFSSSPNFNTVTYPEFQNLWRFLAAWRELFERFDEDSSGRVSLSEFSKALVAFGYRLSQPFVGLLYTAYNEKGIRVDERRGSAGRLGAGGQGMSFDLFVQACISLKRMTDVFKGYDEDRDGYVTLSFEEFLTEILRLRE